MSAKQDRSTDVAASSVIALFAPYPFCPPQSLIDGVRAKQAADVRCRALHFFLHRHPFLTINARYRNAKSTLTIIDLLGRERLAEFNAAYRRLGEQET